MVIVKWYRPLGSIPLLTYLLAICCSGQQNKPHVQPSLHGEQNVWVAFSLPAWRHTQTGWRHHFGGEKETQFWPLRQSMDINISYIRFSHSGSLLFHVSNKAWWESNDSHKVYKATQRPSFPHTHQHLHWSSFGTHRGGLLSRALQRVSHNLCPWPHTTGETALRLQGPPDLELDINCFWQSASTGCISQLHILPLFIIYTVPVKSLDRPTHSRVFFIFTILYIVK